MHFLHLDLLANVSLMGELASSVFLNDAGVTAYMSVLSFIAQCTAVTLTAVTLPTGLLETCTFFKLFKRGAHITDTDIYTQTSNGTRNVYLSN